MQAIDELVARALAEDVGDGDITSQLLLPDGEAQLDFNAREDLVLAGGEALASVYGQLDSSVEIVLEQRDGAKLLAGTRIGFARGNIKSLLTGERVALNIMQRMSGVATLTAHYVEAIKGTRAKILDTRKTMPGMRELDKYAALMGGGENHRMRLDDAVLVKDNHLGFRLPASGFKEIIEEIRHLLASKPEAGSPKPIYVECDTIAQVAAVLAAKPDRIMLDNMSLPELREAVALVAGRVKLEATGGVNLQTVRAIAETGVDYISVGAITHSAAAVDIGADIFLNSLK